MTSGAISCARSFGVIMTSQNNSQAAQNNDDGDSKCCINPLNPAQPRRLVAKSRGYQLFNSKITHTLRSSTVRLLATEYCCFTAKWVTNRSQLLLSRAFRLKDGLWPAGDLQGGSKDHQFHTRIALLPLLDCDKRPNRGIEMEIWFELNGNLFRRPISPRCQVQLCKFIPPYYHNWIGLIV